MTGIEPRLRAPVLTAAVGLALATAALVAAGWAAAAPVAATTVVSAAIYWWVGGTETDIGALIGSRPDERQHLVRLRVRAFAAVALLALGTAAAVVAAALHRTAWPYAAVVGLGSVAFLGGLAFYRTSARTHDVGAQLGSRLDERQASVVLHALQAAGIAMFFAAIAGGLALSGKPGADPLRLTASAFAVLVLLGFALFRPRS